jgi:Flp pilus assembly protein TadG
MFKHPFSPGVTAPHGGALAGVAMRLAATFRQGAAMCTALRRTRRSAVALELAIVSIPFFIMILGTMEVSYDLYVESALNAAVTATARKIADGSISLSDASQGGSGNFVPNYLCPNIAGMLDCSLIQVNVQVFGGAEFYTYGNVVSPIAANGTFSNSSWNVCTGGPGSTMLFQAVYLGPSFVGKLVPGFTTVYNNSWIHVAYTADAFVNSQGWQGGVTCTPVT